jgi:hypothetical protein
MESGLKKAELASRLGIPKTISNACFLSGTNPA